MQSSPHFSQNSATFQLAYLSGLKKKALLRFEIAMLTLGWRSVFRNSLGIKTNFHLCNDPHTINNKESRTNRNDIEIVVQSASLGAYGFESSKSFGSKVRGRLVSSLAIFYGARTVPPIHDFFNGKTTLAQPLKKKQSGTYLEYPPLVGAS